VQVRSAVLHTVEDVAVNTWRVDKQLASDLPDTAYLIKQLSRLEAGETGILTPVQRREARAHGSGTVSNPYVELVRDASQTAAVIEVRTGDRAGLLYARGRS
jgi:[protein-PII] uridylyltransferase